VWRRCTGSPQLTPTKTEISCAQIRLMKPSYIKFTEVGSCPPSGTIVKIGNQDIIDAINESINRFTWDGKVGAAGHMKCQEWIDDHPTPVLWGIYGNSQ